MKDLALVIYCIVKEKTYVRTVEMEQTALILTNSGVIR